MKHKHHIIPKYIGGTDDPSNIIELTVEEHAEAHKVLYEKHGRQEDYLAWKGLTGEIGKEDIINKLRSVGGKKWSQTDANHFKNINWHKENNPRFNPEKQKEYSKLANSGIGLEKKKKTFSKIKHQQGKNNSQYGTRWIHSLTEKRSMRIKKSDSLPKGWLEGRKIKFP